MEELQVIETTSGRQFKPWATNDDLQAAVQDPASVTAITSEIASGKQAIAAAINAKGGEASATESFTELAEAVEEIPNYSDMVKLAGIIAGGNYDKNALQGHNENVKYGKTEIIDNLGAFEKLSYNYMFQYWDLLKKVYMPAITGAYGYSFFKNCTSLEEAIFPNLQRQQGFYMFENCTSLKNLVFGAYTDNNYTASTNGNKPNLHNITMGEGTDANLKFEGWTATNVIAEGQSGIDELNSNLYNNLLTKLYDHSNDGQTRTLRIGWLANVTAENIAYANAKGWTLTT